jgi:predicted metal-dependent peptidase
MKVERIAAARLFLANHRPYLSVALWSLMPKPIEGMGTFAVDKYWRLYYDPQLDWDVQTTAAVLYHEVFHLLRDHAGRASESRDPIIWNLAGDCEINDDIREEGFWNLPENCVYPDTFGLEDGKLAEYYYEQLIKNAVFVQVEGPAPGAGQCGSAAGGPRRPWEEYDGSDKKIGQAEGRLIARKVAEDIRHHRERGTVPAGWARWAEEFLNPKVDWRRELRALIFNSVADVVGKVDYTYRRPSRRQSAFSDVVIPSMTEPMVKVAVIIDTSGSMNQEDLNAALTEVKGILDATGAREGVTVLSVDAAVHSVQRVFSARQVKLAGGGGTDMRVGFDEVARLRPRPNVLVVLSDFYTPWPDSPPKGLSKVIGVCINSDIEPTNVPSWLKVVKVDTRGEG